ncbi:MAG: hypothetical protein M3464_08990 [Chloroflexota bacterium]|nr:hypothetical protein [Chloroflexota bacterium]
MLRTTAVAARCGAVALFLLLLPLGALAHEGRELIGGQYEVEVGFIDEPAYLGEKNGLFLHVVNLAAGTATAENAEEAGAGAPVLGLADTLQAEVIYGDQTMELEVRPDFDGPGTYHGFFFPMAEGDYTFRIFGEIEGNPIDESFTSSPEGFSGVESRAPLEFPK